MAAAGALLLRPSPARRLPCLLQQHRLSSPRQFHTIQPQPAMTLQEWHELEEAKMKVKKESTIAAVARLEKEEMQIKWRKALAMELMRKPGGGDEEAEMKSVSNLLDMLGASENGDHLPITEMQELRSLVEKKKEELLTQLVLENGGRGNKETKEELVCAARRLRDALKQQQQDRTIQTMRKDLNRLQSGKIEADLEMLKESVGMAETKIEGLKSLEDKVAAAEDYIDGLKSLETKRKNRRWLVLETATVVSVIVTLGAYSTIIYKTVNP